MLAGGATDLLRGVLASTHGYVALWPTPAVPVPAAIPVLLPLRRAESRAASR